MATEKQGDEKRGGKIVALIQEKVIRRHVEEGRAMDELFEFCDTHFTPCSDEECDDLIKRVRQNKSK